MRKRVVFSFLLLAITFQDAEAIIIDINSRSNNQANPVEVVLDAGTYAVTPIGTTEGGGF